MIDGIFIMSLVGSCIQGIKDALEPVIPAENLANQDLIREDIANGMSDEEKIRNVKNGRYKMSVKYEEPHRNPKSGKIVIENTQLYYDDLFNYDGYQVDKWIKQGKYNFK